MNLLHCHNLLNHTNAIYPSQQGSLLDSMEEGNDNSDGAFHPLFKQSHKTF